MFRFFILILAVPSWAYEREEVQQTKLPSSPIQVYESQSSETDSAQAQEQAPVQQTQQNPVIIIREQPSVQVYSEPATPQEKLSRARKQAEEQTENKIRTRLELLRLQDEKARMDKVLSPLEDQDVSVQQSTEPAPVQKTIDTTQKSRFSFVHIGMGYLNHYTRSAPYPESIERRGTAFAGGFGLYESRKFSIEYIFNFSRHRVVYPIVNPQYDPRYTLFDLYSHSIAIKYYILSGRLKPFVGLVGSLNMREYSTDVAEHLRYTPMYYWHKRHSTAFQGGVTAGAELFITRRFVAGLELRWSLNIHDLKDMGSNHHYYFATFQAEQPLPEDMSLYGIQGFFRILF
ncbi:MAG: hypothetical protein OXK80_01950 [Bdellovibrionales bacterium]|nr:hypothetical protein [Bdellovibrionales bacterium]